MLFRRDTLPEATPKVTDHWCKEENTPPIGLLVKWRRFNGNDLLVISYPHGRPNPDPALLFLASTSQKIARPEIWLPLPRVGRIPMTCCPIEMRGRSDFEPIACR